MATNTITTTNINEFSRMAIRATRLGVPSRSLERFLRASYLPLPRALELHAAAAQAKHIKGQALIGYGGARGEAKSHAIFAQAVIDDCQQQELKWLYLRKIKDSAEEQFSDLISIIKNVPHDYKNKIVKIRSTGSTIRIGGYKDKGQLATLLGIQYDGIIIEDGALLPAQSIVEIRGALRTTKPGWKPRIYMSTNPGGVGHGWFKKMFWDPYQQKREKNTRFIWARPGDNPYIDPGYREYLDGLTGWLRRAWRDGDFSIAAGQFFTAFDPTVHVIEPFHIDQHQLYWCSMDYGTIHWNTTLLFARLGQDYYVIDEHAARRQLAEQNAAEIKEMLRRNNINTSHLRAFVAGPDVFAERGAEKTIAQRYAENGIDLTAAITNRVNGAARIRDLLGNPTPTGDEIYISPRLKIFNRCHRLIETLPEMQHDPARGEDILKVDCDPDTGEGGDDPIDTVRYGLMEDLGTYGVGKNPMAGYRG